MQSQMCKICGHRHHRYEPHQLQAAPEAPRSNSRSPTRHRPDTEPRAPSDNPLSTTPDHAPDTPDTEPLSHQRLDDIALPPISRPHTAPSPPSFVCESEEFLTAPIPAISQEALRREGMPDPPLAIVQEVIFDWNEFNVAALDDATLHALRNLTAAEWMKRERRRKREEQENG